MVIRGKRQLQNKDCSLALSPPKYKLQKVSAVRDFPFGCGPHAALINVHTKEAVRSWLKSVGDRSKVVVYRGLKGDGPFDLEGKGSLGEVVESQSHYTAACSESSGEATSILLKYKNAQRVIEELPGLPVDLRASGLSNELIIKDPKSSENLIEKMEESTSKDEIHDKSNDLVKVKVDSPSAFKNNSMIDLIKGQNDSKSEMIEGSSLQLCLLPHYPIPSHLVGRERKYPPRNTVSAVRDFPSGCGCNAQRLSEDEDRHLGQDEAGASTHKVVVRNDEHQTGVEFDANIISRDELEGRIPNMKAKGEGQSDEGAFGVMTMPSCHYGKYSEIKGQVQVPKAKSNEQHGGLMEKAINDGTDEGNVLVSEDGLSEEIMVYRKVKHSKEMPILDSCRNIGSPEERMTCLQHKEDRVVILCLMAAPNCPWKRGREAAKSNLSSTYAKRNKRKKRVYAEGDEHKGSPDKSEVSTTNLGESSTANIPYLNDIDTNEFSSISRGEGDSCKDEELSHDFLLVPRKCDFDVNLPPFGAVSSSERGIRSKVRETLRLFHTIVRKLQQEVETKSTDKENATKRIDLNAGKILKDHGKYINSSEKSILGPVPGVEVGDVFHFRIELAIVGLHRPLQSGIETLNIGHTTIATSIVASGGYANDVDSPDVLIYTGQGGHASGDKQPEDQKLERGNLALKNSIDVKNDVRVIRGFKERKFADTDDGRPKTIATYTYDGLYTVEKYWHDIGPHGKLVYKFELIRRSGQPELPWKEVARSEKYNAREGCCVDDISDGRETVPICAINTLDDEKPPSFTYISSMIYPDWCKPIPPRGCNCTDGCSDSERCACAVKNGGEIPYNYDGAIVEAKPLVYECGPSCKCPSTCHNRVSQYGVKFSLEIFKTESRGWGVRCRSSIPSGSFICEYIGELLDDKEAEQRAGSDEYLFDIGQNYNDPTLCDGLSALMPDGPSSSNDVVENVGFTIDAAKYGNIGRFINHSCSPNLYAQNVLYDHEDERIPHVMLFAAENIPPLQELSYDYNYAIDQVLDSDGNVKKKNCYCGSSECTGRMY